MDAHVVRPSEEPEIFRHIHPTDSTSSRPRNVARCRRALRAIHARLVNEVRPAHPCPLPTAYVVLPQVVHIPACPGCQIEERPSEEPEISRRIRPTDSTMSRPRNVARCRRALRAIHARLVNEVRPAHPCPLPTAYVVLPQVVHIPACPGCQIEERPSEEPEISRRIRPTDSTSSRLRNVARCRR